MTKKVAERRPGSFPKKRLDALVLGDELSVKT